MADDLDERTRSVLQAVVQEFIAGGEPVGSKQLVQRPDFEVSPATMRSLLAELEELGYLHKPHTSAGRVPTDAGFRYFVDKLVELRVPGSQDRTFIEQELLARPSVNDSLADASRLLHQLSHHASLVVTPRPQSLVITHLEFVQLRHNKVMAILVGQGGQIHNRLIELDSPIDASTLQRVSNYLSELLRTGLPLDGVRERILREMEDEKNAYDGLAQRALRLGALATDLRSDERLVIEGTGSFLDAREFVSDVSRMRSLFRALDDKHRLLQLLDRVQRAGELQIFIGAESDFSAQPDITVIASPYGAQGQMLGTVGVIGPTRLDYQRVIPLVEFTAGVLSRLVDSSWEPPK